MLSCKEITELCTEYLERRMSPMDRLRFRLHIAMCKVCRMYIDQMQATVDALGRMPEGEIPPHVEGELMNHFRNWKSAN